MTTTSMSDLLVGLERLRVPRVFVAITGSMMRYGEVITGEMRRMKIARQSRGYDPRWMWQSKAVASLAGALFVRSFERGERVYLAMASRGYDGSLPPLEQHSASRRRVVPAMTVPLLASVHRHPRVGDSPREFGRHRCPRRHVCVSRRSAGAVQCHPARATRRAGCRARPQRSGQDHAHSSLERYPCRDGR